MLTAFAVPYLQVLAGPISRRTRSKTTFLTQHINESFYGNLPSPDIAYRIFPKGRRHAGAMTALRISASRTGFLPPSKTTLPILTYLYTGKPRASRDEITGDHDS